MNDDEVIHQAFVDAFETVDKEVRTSDLSAEVCRALRDYMRVSQLGGEASVVAWARVIRRFNEWELAQ